MAISLYDLTHDQITLLKQQYLCATKYQTSWSELANADSLVSDETIEDLLDDKYLEDHLGYEYEHACYSF